VNLLLDTHVFLWWLEGSRDLSEAARQAISDPENTVYVSAACYWEIAIKQGRGQLRAPSNLIALSDESGFVELPINAVHALAVGDLPRLHADPFDRILIAQTQIENLTLVTRDAQVSRYEVETIRA